MQLIDKQTELPDIQWCEWDFKAMKLRVNWRLVSLGSDQIPHVMFGVSDENEAEEYALIFCKPKLEVYNDSGKQFNLELDSSIHITSLAIVPVDKVHASTMGFVYFFASCVYGEFRLGKIDLYDSKITWIGSVMSLKVLDLYDDIHSCIEMMPAVQSMKIIAGTLQDTQKNPSPYLPTTHSFVPDGRLVALCYHPIYGTQVAVQVDAESGNHPFPAHTFSSWNLHFSEARGVMNPALPIHRGKHSANVSTLNLTHNDCIV